MKWKSILWNWVILPTNLFIFLIKTFPAWLIWILTGFAVKLDFRESSWEPIVVIPGWSKHELTWYVSYRFMIAIRMR